MKTSKIPNYFPSLAVDNTTPSYLESWQRKTSVFYVLASCVYCGVFLSWCALEWQEHSFEAVAAILPLPAIYAAEDDMNAFRANYGKVIPDYVQHLWDTVSPSVSSGGGAGAWGGGVRSSLPEVPISIYMHYNPSFPKNVDGETISPVEVNGYVLQEFSAYSRCTDHMFSTIDRREEVTILTDTASGVTKFKVSGNYENFPYESLVTKNFPFASSIAADDISVTRINAKFCGSASATSRSMSNDYVSLVVPVINDFVEEDYKVYKVDIAIDAPLRWTNCHSKDISDPCKLNNQVAVTPSLEFDLRPGVEIIASLRLDIILDENNDPVDGGYRLTVVGERERTPGLPRTFDGGVPECVTSGDCGSNTALKLSLELTEVYYVKTSRTSLSHYIFVSLSEMGGGLGIITTIFALLAQFKEKRQRGKEKKALDEGGDGSNML